MWNIDGPSAAGLLDEQGVWVSDGAVSEEVAESLRAEILSAHSSGLLVESGNVLAVKRADGSRGGTALPKPNVFEADLLAEGAVQRRDVIDTCPTLRKLLDDESELRHKLNQARPSLALSGLDQAKIQVNDGAGGAFPHHFDLPSAQTSRRHVTAILYLNPNWREGDGGEVEMLPFPFADVVAAPLNCRLVVFSSRCTMHRVRPFFGTQRVCINLWINGNIEEPFPVPLQFDTTGAKMVRILRRNPQELRAFCKVWYDEAIAQSFRDAFAPCAVLQAALELHTEEAAEVKRRIEPSVLHSLRESFPFESQVVVAEADDFLAGFADAFG